MTKFRIVPMTVSELAALYNVDRCTFRRWLQPHAEKIGQPLPKTYSYTTAQVKLIFENLGYPFEEVEV